MIECFVWGLVTGLISWPSILFTVKTYAKYRADIQQLNSE